MPPRRRTPSAAPRSPPEPTPASRSGTGSKSGAIPVPELRRRRPDTSRMAEPPLPAPASGGFTQRGSAMTPTPSGQSEAANESQHANHDPRSAAGHEALRNDLRVESLKYPDGTHQGEANTDEDSYDPHTRIVDPRIQHPERITFACPQQSRSEDWGRSTHTMPWARRRDRSAYGEVPGGLRRPRERGPLPRRREDPYLLGGSVYRLCLA